MRLSTPQMFTRTTASALSLVLTSAGCGLSVGEDAPIDVEPQSSELLSVSTDDGLSVDTALGVSVSVGNGNSTTSNSSSGEVDYSLAYCGGPNFSPAPTISTVVDLPLIFSRIATYTLTPQQLYDAPWTNWYEASSLNEKLAKLSTMRTILEENNLWNTYKGWFPAAAACPADAATVRQPDGTCNDIDRPAMGSAGTRFGRNMDPTSTAAHQDPNLMSPNPREISRKLFTRDVEKPVPFLNMLSAAWIQYNIHDWVNHSNSTQDFWEIPLATDDPLYSASRTKLYVPKTAPDSTRKPQESALGPTYNNTVTHWWDASPLYGSSKATSDRLRSFEGGHLKLDASGLLPSASDGSDDTGFKDNWWVGLAIIHNLFVREHNAIADNLHQAHPDFTDQELFNKARLINAAVIAKIHTVEWTPAIIPNPALEVAMNSNWYGLNKYLSPKLIQLPSYVPVPYTNVVFGIRGGERELHKNPGTLDDAAFAMTEEFTSVYRMHSLLPDTINIYSPGEGLIDTVALEDTREKKARSLQQSYGLRDLLYSFGVRHPGGLVLQNYPQLLQNVDIPNVGLMDMGAVDILRDRERGIPRYNEFRRRLKLKPLSSIDQLTDNATLRSKLKAVYGSDTSAIERVDLLAGTLAEATRPTCYGFGETLFQVFIVMASRRLHGDRFYTESYNEETYTAEGLTWIDNATMKGVLLRHFPELGSTGLADQTNAFYPWE